MTTTRKYLLIHILIIAAVLGACLVAYSHLPAQIAVHWSHQQPDKFMAKQKFHWWVSPGFWLMGVFLLIAYLGPWLSPKQFEVDSFRSTYLQILTMSLLLCAYIVALNFWVAFGHRPNQLRAALAGVFLSSILNGNLAGKIRRNFFIGIKTPWTLASERVWNATHRFAAKFFVAWGLLGLALTIAAPHYLNFAAIAIVAAAAVIPRVYSLVLYKQLERRGEIAEKC